MEPAAGWAAWQVPPVAGPPVSPLPVRREVVLPVVLEEVQPVARALLASLDAGRSVRRALLAARRERREALRAVALEHRPQAVLPAGPVLQARPAVERRVALRREAPLAAGPFLAASVQWDAAGGVRAWPAVLLLAARAPVAPAVGPLVREQLVAALERVAAQARPVAEPPESLAAAVAPRAAGALPVAAAAPVELAAVAVELGLSDLGYSLSSSVSQVVRLPLPQRRCCC
jgi:hypothetical protein